MNKFQQGALHWHKVNKARAFGHSHLPIRALVTTPPQFISNTKDKKNLHPAPKTREEPQKFQGFGLGEDELVISGLSGRFPMSDNLEELTQNLYNGVDMVKEQTRWTLKFGIPTQNGFMKNLDKFDAEFFGINRKLADVMDPQQRKLLEVAFEAIVDAGINPESLRGTKTGVYVGGLGGELMDYWTLKANADIAGGYAAVAFPNFMLANRLSYSFDLKGPSIHISTGCSASLVALEAAVRDLRTGNCEAAMVCGATIHFSPAASASFNNIGALSPDGRCKAFDDEANGFVRSEAVISMLIQKKKHAKRNYATIRHAKSNCDGYTPEGLVFPSTKSQEQLLREVYEEAEVDPGKVVYVEAHGTGTPAGDPQELESIYNVLSSAPSRTEPLLIGSIKSNLGHTESAAGLAGITKLILSMQKGTIPGNLHFKKPNEACKHLFGETLKVVTEATPIQGGLVGVSSFGIGGSNAHVILEAPIRNSTPPKVSQSPHLNIPLLLPYSGRSSTSVEESLKNVSAQAVENEAFRGLVQGVFSKKIFGHTHRGFAIVQEGAEAPIIQTETLHNYERRPLWYVFPGMGSQWNEMGKDLMKVDAFRESIKNSVVTLRNAGVDLESLLAPGNPSIFHSIRDSMVSITAIQIALYDTMTSLGLHPEGFLGHSSGEILCAYADGCFSGEEALLVADARGRALLDTTKTPGGMAAVGLPWKDIKERCPPTLHPACHNGKKNVSVSGPLDAVRDFVKELQQEGVFALEVNTCNCAPHSSFVLPAADILLNSMDGIISGDRPRSSRWVSTSVPRDQWDSPMAQNSSPAYHVHNMINPVLFYEALQHVPANAVVVEVAPHGLFQGLLKDSTSKDCSHIAPMSSTVEDKVVHFLSSLGKVHNAGVDVSMDKLYPSINFPVSNLTPSLSPFVTWDHSKTWDVPIVQNPCVGRIETRIDMRDESNMYLNGHRLDSRVVYPGMGYLYLGWKGMAATMGLNYKSTPVVFENVQFKRASFLGEEKPTTFIFNMFGETGEFQITEGGEPVVSGSVSNQENAIGKMFPLKPVEIPEESPRLNLNTEDFYKELTLRGYNYDGAFRGVESADHSGRWAKVSWKGNWVSFLDALLQTMAMSALTRATVVPTMFQQITIDPNVFLDYVSKSNDSFVPVSIHPKLRTIQCPGIEIRGMEAHVVSRRKQEGTLSVEEYKFRPYFDPEIQPSEESLNLPSLQSTTSEIVEIAWENMAKRSRVNINNLFSKPENCLAESIAQVMAIKPWARYDLTLTSSTEVMGQIDEKVQKLGKVVNVENLEEISLPERTANFLFVDESANLEAMGNSLADNGYLVVKSEAETDTIAPQDLVQIARKNFDQGTLSLFRKVANGVEAKVQALTIEKDNFDWLPKLQDLLKTENTDKIFLVSQNDPENGILGLVKCLRLEPGGERIRCIFDPEGSLELNFAAPNEQLQKIIQQDLVMNIVKKDQLGAYRHISVQAEDLVAPNKATESAYVDILNPGDLTSLRWTQMPFNSQSYRGEVLCQVHYASMNFRDIMVATGKLPLVSDECAIGAEFAGIDLSTGRRVMGIPKSKAMATHIRLPPQVLWHVPDHWTLEEAATVPLVYFASYYALYGKARLQRGQSVLIHSGTGGLGQAAINIALDADCEVFTTVGSPEKRELIKELFPQIKDQNIGNSRDCSFEPQIMSLTRGKGVDIVVNSLADDKLQASLRCVALHGKFLEMGKYDAFMNNKIGLKSVLKNIDFFGVAPDRLEMDTFGHAMELMGHYLEDGIKRGVVKPLSRTVFNKDQVEDAFRYMTSGKHTGKVVIKVRDESQDLNQPVLVNAVARSYFDPQKYYAIIGGLGGLGLEVANFLVDRGARKLVLLSRSGVKNGYQDLCIRKWEERGVEVETPSLDLSDFAVAEAFIQDLNERGTVGGIFNSGLVLQDAPIEDQTEEAFKLVAAPKIQVTKNLDQLTRQYCKELDHFVVFSSLACGRGNAYQSNYGFANSSMEHICERRAQEGLPGLSIQWSAIGEAGYVAEKILKSKVPKAGGEELFEGTVPQRISSCLEVLDYALQHSSTSMSCFSTMVVSDRDRRRGQNLGLVAIMSNILGIKSLDKINPATKLLDFGLDSLAGIELKMILERDYDLFFTPKELKKLTLGDVLAIDAGTFNKSQIGGDSSSSSGSFFLDVHMLKPPVEMMVKLNDVERKPDSPALFVVHGVDGNVKKLKVLGEKLNFGVYGLQYSNWDGQNVKDIAELYIKAIKAVQPKGPYILAGYSLGGTIINEISSVLEKDHQEEVSDLIVLDGCLSYQSMEKDTTHAYKYIPGTLQHILELGEVTEKKLLEAVGEDFAGSAEDCIELLVSAYPEVAEYREEMTDYMSRSLKLTGLINEYHTDYKYNGRAHLIRAEQKNFVMLAVHDDKHYMQEVCTNDVNVHIVPGNHESFLHDELVSRHVTEIWNQAHSWTSPDIKQKSREMSAVTQ